MNEVAGRKQAGLRSGLSPEDYCTIIGQLKKEKEKEASTDNPETRPKFFEHDETMWKETWGSG